MWTNYSEMISSGQKFKLGDYRYRVSPNFLVLVMLPTSHCIYSTVITWELKRCLERLLNDEYQYRYTGGSRQTNCIYYLLPESLRLPYRQRATTPRCIHQRGSQEAKIWKHLVVFTTTRGDPLGGEGYIFQYILPYKNRGLVAIRLEVAIMLG
jgi:hypothetical protein